MIVLITGASSAVRVADGGKGRKGRETMSRIALLIFVVFFSGCTVGAPPFVEDAGIDDLTGEYTMSHTIMHVGEDGWEESVVRDTLSISLQGDTVSFYFALVQANYHICEMGGTGARTSEGIAAPPELIEFGGEEDVCRLRIVAERDTIRLVDEGNVCRRYYCGARAYIDGVAFPRQ